MDECLSILQARRNILFDSISAITSQKCAESKTNDFDKTVAEGRELCDIVQQKFDRYNLLKNDSPSQGFVAMNEVLQTLGIATETIVEPVLPTVAAVAANVIAPSVVAPENRLPAKTTSILREVTAEEWEAVPKYLRLRLSSGDINQIIECLTSYFEEKRRLLNSPLRKLNQKDRDRVTKWKEQETSMTGSSLFIVESELREVIPDKIRKNLKTGLPCLRHLKVVKELRDKGVAYIFPA